MPIKKSAFKELRKAKKRHLRNIRVISELKTLNKKFVNFVDEKNTEQAKKILNQLIVKLDKAATKKIIHKKCLQRWKNKDQTGQATRHNILHSTKILLYQK